MNMSTPISRHNNPTLKTSLICLSITIFVVLGFTVGEQALYMHTFPSSSAYVEIDGVYYHIGIVWSSNFQNYDFTIRLYTDRTMGEFPQVNATEMWVIPSVGIWAWRNYEVLNLEFDQVINGTLYRIDYGADQGYTPPRVSEQVDIIVKLNATLDRVYYLHYYDINLV